MHAPLRSASLLTFSFAVGLSLATSSKPCSSLTGPAVSDSLLARATIARGLAGTERVGLDRTGQCISITVRTEGTVRLVKLLLRGVDVPASAVLFQVDSAAAMRRQT